MSVPLKQTSMTDTSNWLTLGVLHEAILALSKAQTAEDLYQAVIENSRWILPHTKSWIFVRDEDKLQRCQMMGNNGTISASQAAHVIPESIGKKLEREHSLWEKRDTIIRWFGDDFLTASNGSHHFLLLPVKPTEHSLEATLVFGLPDVDVREKEASTLAMVLFSHHVAMALGFIKARQRVDDLARLPEENPNPIFRISAAGNVLYANEAAKNLVRGLGETESRVIQKQLSSTTAATLTSHLSSESELYLSNRSYEVTTCPVPKSNYANLYLRDTTEKKKVAKEKKQMQTQLIQASKLSSLGTLAAGVAHELNNPLAAIKGFAHIITKSIEKKEIERVETQCDKIIHASERMAKIINHLREFARESKSSDWRNCSVNNIIEDSLILLQAQLVNRNIGIQKNLAPKIPDVYCDPVQLESVFQNLIVNSRDAFVSLEDNRQKTLIITTKTVGQEIIISFLDNASGMDQETRSKAFEPFYTTKDAASGTGLGLSISHGIIELHKGSIALDSQLGEGTSFQIRLPVSTHAQIASHAQAPKISTSSSVHRILIIDDEPLILEVLKEYLRDRFKVLAFTSPRQALAYLDKDSNFDLIITDLRMPEVRGEDVIRNVSRNHPFLKVIAMSGHAYTDDDLRNFRALGAVDFVQKPFADSDEIIHTLERHLVKRAS